MKSTDPPNSEVDKTLRRLRKKAARGSVQKNALAAGLAKLKRDGKISPAQHDEALGIKPSDEMKS